MSKLAITNAGTTYKDQVFAGDEVQNITHFLFCNVPGLDAESDIDIDQPVPTQNIVHSAPIERVSQLNENAVVMSAALGYDVGDFDYNWYGVIATKQDNSEVLVAVVQTENQNKRKTNGAITGNYSVKSIVWKTANIAQALNISLSTLPWQVADNTFVLQEVFDLAMADKLDKTAAATDSEKLEGKTKAEVVAEARSGLSANTHRDISDSVTSTSSSVSASSKAVKTAYDKAVSALTKSNDSSKLEGKTKAQVVSEARSGLAAAALSSKSASGYWKCGSTGVIVQWGTGTVASGNTTKTHNFPTAFPSACVSAAITIRSTGTSDFYPVYIYSRSKTQIIARNTQGNAKTYDWIAIGY